MSLEGSASPLRPDQRPWSELENLASAHLAIANAIGRMIRAISTGRETLIGIEHLRLQTAVDQYRNRVIGITAALETSDEDTRELRHRLSQMQRAFRAELQSKATHLASACSSAEQDAQTDAPLR